MVLLEKTANLEVLTITPPTMYKVGAMGKVSSFPGSLKIGKTLILFVAVKLQVSKETVETAIRSCMSYGYSNLQVISHRSYTQDVALTIVQELNNFLPPKSREKIEFILIEL